MQLILIALIVGILIHDTQAMPSLAEPRTAVTLLLVPKFLLAAIYAYACRRTLLALGTHSGPRRLARLDRISVLYRATVLVMFGLDLWVGTLARLREGMSTLLRAPLGDPILVDECLFLLPPLLMICWGWAVYYPIDRRLREALLIQQIDAGMVIHPIWTRGQYLLNQIRHHMALILVPMLLLIGWSECVETFTPRDTGLMLPALLQLGGTATIFLLAPLVIRHLWDTVPLPEGELRHHLLKVCRQHGVVVRELLLWRTFGGMINAAVMGILRPVRFILLTDGLLEQLPLPEVEAVMAHELAHVRKQHTIWLILVTVALLAGVGAFFNIAAEHAETWLTGQAVHLGILHASMVGIIAGGWIMGFGWVSRRFERQADAFAVRHMAEGEHVDADAVGVMTRALERVATLNHVPVARRSWRHGSIAWRQDYLHSLVGTSVDVSPIDRTVTRIKAAALAVLTLLSVTHLPL